MKKVYFIMLIMICMVMNPNMSLATNIAYTENPVYEGERSLFDEEDNEIDFDISDLQKPYLEENAQLFEDIGVSITSASSFISNSNNRTYIDMMIQYYLNTYPQLMSNLKSGMPVVAIFEGGSDNVDNKTYNSDNKYRVAAVTIVLKYDRYNDCVYISFASENCSTLPDHPLAYGAYESNGGMGSLYGTATIKDGIYELYTVNHKSEYAAFKVKNSGSSLIPSIYMKNDGSYTETTSSGIHVHTRTYPWNSGKSKPWSAGCLLVGASTPFNEYNAFIDDVAPSNVTKTNTTYKENTIYKFSTTGTKSGMLIVDRYLHKEKLKEIYQNENAVNCITTFSTNAYSNAIADTEAPTISNVKVTNISGQSFTINCDLNDNVGVKRVWLNVYGPNDNSNGYEVAASNGTFSHTINTAEYGGEGVYAVHIYAFDYCENSTSWNDSETLCYDIVDLGADFKAYIEHIPSTNFITIDDEGVVASAQTGAASQIWHFYRQTDGSYTIANVINYSYMEMENSSSDGGLKIILNEYTGDRNQHFYVYSINGSYYIKPVDTRFHLDVNASTSNVELWYGKAGWDPQRFNIKIVDDNGYLPANFGVDFKAEIIHLQSNMYITKTEDNILAEEKDETTKTQTWHFYRQPDGSYTIASIFDYSYMEIEDSGADGGLNVYPNLYIGYDRQHFFIYEIEGVCYIKPAYTQFHLDLNASTSNIELWYGKLDWEPQEFIIQKVNEYTITYDSNEGYGMMTPSNHVYGISQSLPKNSFVRNGYEFSGWNTTKDGSGEYYEDGESVINLTTTDSDEIVLYAQWTANKYLVTFDVNGGVTGTTCKFVVYDSTYGELPIPKRDGYIFLGWYTAIFDGQKVTSEKYVTEANDVTLYALWEKAIPHIESSVEQSGENIVVDVEIHNIKCPCRVIVVYYKNGTVVDVQTKIFNKRAGEFSTTVSADTVKIMTWDSLSTLKPVCEAEIISLK